MSLPLAPSYPLAIRTTFIGAHLSMGNWVQELDARCMQWFDQKLTQIKVAMLAYGQLKGKISVAFCFLNVI
jgi:hypothetical protein